MGYILHMQVSMVPAECSWHYSMDEVEEEQAPDTVRMVCMGAFTRVSERQVDELALGGYGGVIFPVQGGAGFLPRRPSLESACHRRTVWPSCLGQHLGLSGGDLGRACPNLCRRPWILCWPGAPWPHGAWRWRALPLGGQRWRHEESPLLAAWQIFVDKMGCGHKCRISGHACKVPSWIWVSMLPSRTLQQAELHALGTEHRNFPGRSSRPLSDGGAPVDSYLPDWYDRTPDWLLWPAGHTVRWMQMQHFNCAVSPTGSDVSQWWVGWHGGYDASKAPSGRFPGWGRDDFDAGGNALCATIVDAPVKKWLQDTLLDTALCRHCSYKRSRQFRSEFWSVDPFYVPECEIRPVPSLFTQTEGGFSPELLSDAALCRHCSYKRRGDPCLCSSATLPCAVNGVGSVGGGTWCIIRFVPRVG